MKNKFFTIVFISIAIVGVAFAISDRMAFNQARDYANTQGMTVAWLDGKSDAEIYQYLNLNLTLSDGQKAGRLSRQAMIYFHSRDTLCQVQTEKNSIRNG